ncbi:Ser/thr kinase [Monkeypox virus]|nr:Ser/thr kinase [Monkeypox virus]UYF06861.1 Ser/thr kinase [Monkeypox virus]UZL87461.1 Ser/thr kinase [Monkeypox virus]UZL88158.1 Ser/thr kinase [Monkeypox virus]UZL88509.1 Ser/thr kinase [Monkeypox virus]
MKFQGLVLIDNCKNQWVVGPLIGKGGFGSIYTTNDNNYVVKIEPKANGSLFTEQAFYTRVLKPSVIEEWKKSHNIKHVGLITCKAFGLYKSINVEYRFLVINRLGADLDAVIRANNNRLPERSVMLIGIEILNTIQFMHEQGYSHGDIKASNIVLDQIDKNKLYLVDYGLVSKFMSNGEHVPFIRNPNKMDNGTLEFTPIDSHKGYVVSRRGDLETLGYCMIRWLGGILPWTKISETKNSALVSAAKQKYVNNTATLLMTSLQYAPKELLQYITMVNSLTYFEEPNYDEFRRVLMNGVMKNFC